MNEEQRGTKKDTTKAYWGSGGVAPRIKPP